MLRKTLPFFRRDDPVGFGRAEGQRVMHQELLTLSAGLAVQGGAPAERECPRNEEGSPISPEDFHGGILVEPKVPTIRSPC